MHQSVLLKELIDAVNPKEGDVVVDGTLGAGGHTQELCERLGESVKVVAFDLDTDAIERSKQKLGERQNVVYVNDNFKNIDKVLKDLGIDKVDAIMLDLGYSSDQLEHSGRGISFQKDEPLSMTLRKEKGGSEFDAKDIVNTWAEEDIANVLYAYGEERFARRIAREIVEARDKAPIDTTTDLVKIIQGAVPSFYRNGRIHPATKTFQALRIVVNDELESLRLVIGKGMALLNPGGRLAIITFHSLEDRIVKHFFRQIDAEGQGKIITKKPITPSTEELKENKRSRSAKLRVIEKI